MRDIKLRAREMFDDEWRKYPYAEIGKVSDRIKISLTKL